MKHQVGFKPWDFWSAVKLLGLETLTTVLFAKVWNSEVFKCYHWWVADIKANMNPTSSGKMEEKEVLALQNQIKLYCQSSFVSSLYFSNQSGFLKLSGWLVSQPIGFSQQHLQLIKWSPNKHWDGQCRLLVWFIYFLTLLWQQHFLSIVSIGYHAQVQNVQ